MASIPPHLVTSDVHIRTLRIHKPANSSDVLSELQVLQEKELFTDAVIVGKNGKRIAVHSLVLVAGSEFIKGWMDSTFVPNLQYTILLPDVDIGDIEVLCRILYGTSDLRLSPSAFDGLREAMDLLGISIELPADLMEEQQEEELIIPDKVPPLCCWHCSRPFETLGELQLHKTSEHRHQKLKTKPHRCQKCKKLLPSMWKLRQHLLTHTTSNRKQLQQVADHEYAGRIPTDRDGSDRTPSETPALDSLVSVALNDLTPPRMAQQDSTPLMAQQDSTPLMAQQDSSPLRALKDRSRALNEMTPPSSSVSSEHSYGTKLEIPEGAEVKGGERYDHPYSMRTDDDVTSVDDVMDEAAQRSQSLTTTDHPYSFRKATPSPTKLDPKGAAKRKSLMTPRRSAPSVTARKVTPSLAPRRSSVTPTVSMTRRSVQEMGHSYAAMRPRRDAEAKKKAEEFPCDKCDKVFPQLYRRRRHEREVHDKEKKHACSKCDKQFFKVSSLSRHELTHTEHNLWVCEGCDKNFRDQSSLKYHVMNNVCAKRRKKQLWS